MMPIKSGDVEVVLSEFDNLLRGIRRQYNVVRGQTSEAVAEIPAFATKNSEVIDYLNNLTPSGAVQELWVDRLQILTSEAASLAADLQAVKDAISDLDL